MLVVLEENKGLVYLNEQHRMRKVLLIVSVSIVSELHKWEKMHKEKCFKWQWTKFILEIKTELLPIG